MKRIFFALIVLFTISVNAQVTDTVKVMNIHTIYDYVEKNEISNISQINFYDNYMCVSNKYIYIDHIDYVDFSEKVYHDKINVTPEIYKKDFTKDEVIEAFEYFTKNCYLNNCLGGIYMMRGGKEG